MAQTVGVVTIGITTGGLEDALTQKVSQAVVDIGRVPAILDGRGQAGDQPGLSIYALQQEGTEITGNGTAFEVGTDGETSHGGKTKLGRDRITHGRSRLSFVRSVIGVIQIISMG